MQKTCCNSKLRQYKDSKTTLGSAEAPAKMAHELQLSKVHAKSRQNTVGQAECSKGFGRGTLLLRGNRLNRGVLFQCVCVCGRVRFLKVT